MAFNKSTVSRTARAGEVVRCIDASGTSLLEVGNDYRVAYVINDGAFKFAANGDSIRASFDGPVYTLVNPSSGVGISGKPYFWDAARFVVVVG